MISTPPLWLLKLLECESLRWDELPEELQLTLPYCPLEVAQEVIRIFKEKMDDLEVEVEDRLTYMDIINRMLQKRNLEEKNI